MKILSDAIWRQMELELDAKRQEGKLAQERIDRLMEALARKSGADLMMPQPALPILEPSVGWWDKKSQ